MRGRLDSPSSQVAEEWETESDQSDLDDDFPPDFSPPSEESVRAVLGDAMAAVEAKDWGYVDNPFMLQVRAGLLSLGTLLFDDADCS